MYTVCPQCNLTLIVTVADLRIGQGYVRCGRCSTVFNALVSLSEDRDAKTAPGTPMSAAATQSRPALNLDELPPALAGESEETPTSETSEEEPPQEQAALAEQDTVADEAAPALEDADEIDSIPESELEFDPTSANLDEVFVEAERPPTPSSPAQEAVADPQHDLEPQEDVAPQEELESEPEVIDVRSMQADSETQELDAELRAIVARLDQPGSETLSASSEALRDEEPNRTAGEDVLVETSAAAEYEPAAEASDIPPERWFDEQEETPSSPWARAAWAGAAIVLVLTLAAQVIHHYRHEIAAANLQAGRLLTSLYGALGMPLVPRWDLEAYEVRQLGAYAGADRPGQLTVRASVLNSAERPQPAPVLRVTVHDRFGNPIASGDVMPASYLRGDSAGKLLAAGQRVDAELAFADPGQDAVGFEVDACLPSARGAIVCANDSRPR